MDTQAVLSWYRTNARDLPWRRAGFSAWGTLVSEFMLQQTQVSRVVPILLDWLERWPTPADLAAVPPAEVLRAWGRLGYPRRALALHRCATAIAEQHGNRVPEEVDQLLALPGIGDYTARAIAVFAYGHRHPVVDTNVRRVIARAELGRAAPTAPNARRDLPAMAELLPAGRDDAATFNAALMEIGAVVCVAAGPRCDACPLAATCRWRAAGHPAGPVGTRRQVPFADSNRQWRGRVMAELRVSHVPVTDDELATIIPDAELRTRILASLRADGLVEVAAAGWTLPTV